MIERRLVTASVRKPEKARTHTGQDARQRLSAGLTRIERLVEPKAHKRGKAPVKAGRFSALIAC